MVSSNRFSADEGSSRILMQRKAKLLILRPVSEEDCRLLWEWASDPEVRAVSFASEPIYWEDHFQWFKSKLVDPHCFFYIAINKNGEPIGQIRYEIKGDEAVVSISIDWRFRNQGYGSSLIDLASQKLLHNSTVVRINAYIKLGNQSSVKAFIKAGFQSTGIKILRGHPANHLVLNR